MSDEKLLNFIYKNAQMGVIGIDAVKGYARSPGLFRELNNQKREYRKICRTASAMEQEKRAGLREVGPVAKKSADLMCRMRLMPDNSDSRIAEMMINGSATGVSKIIKNKRAYGSGDERVKNLADKLLLTEQNNIETMKGFL